MKQVIFACILLAVAGTANADIPFLNATCAKGIQVHADENGPISISGKEAKLKQVDDNTYAATSDGMTVTLTVGADGSPAVSMAGKDHAVKACQVEVQDD